MSKFMQTTDRISKVVVILAALILLSNIVIDLLLERYQREADKMYRKLGL